MAGETAAGNLDLRAEHTHLAVRQEERGHPIVDACTHNEHLGTLGQGAVHGRKALWPQQVGRVVGKAPAAGIEGFERHSPEVEREEALLGPAVGVEFQLHQHQQRGVEQQSAQQGGQAPDVANEGEQRVAGGERAVEVEGIQPLAFGCRRALSGRYGVVRGRHVVRAHRLSSGTPAAKPVPRAG